jgi:hypothetical protein
MAHLFMFGVEIPKVVLLSVNAPLTLEMSEKVMKNSLTS